MITRFRKIPFLMLLFSFVALAQTDSLYYSASWRTYILHLPSMYTGSVKLPLVIALNGLGGSASGFETITGFSAKADTENFIVIYLNGTGSPASWNCGGNWSATVTNTTDDVGYISTLIDTLTKRYTIDSTRIYAVGFSNGSMMAYRLAAELSAKIAAIAAGSGPLTLRTIHPSHPVALIHFHALDDSSIPYIGVTDSHAPVYFPPIDTLMAVWRGINGCSTVADTLVNSPGVIAAKWAAANTHADVVLYRSNTGGHAWPIGSLAETAIAWNFLKSYTRTASISSIGQNTHETPQAFSLEQNFPNPFNPSTVITFSIGVYCFTSMHIYDVLGRDVAALVNSNKPAGTYTIQWNASNLPSGVYFYCLRAGSFTQTRKFVLLK